MNKLFSRAVLPIDYCSAVHKYNQIYIHIHVQQLTSCEYSYHQSKLKSMDDRASHLNVLDSYSASKSECDHEKEKESWS